MAALQVLKRLCDHAPPRPRAQVVVGSVAHLNCATAFMPSLFTSSVPLAFASFLPDIHHLILNNLHILTSNALASCAHADSTDNSALHPPAQSAPSINFAVRRRNDRHETSPSFLSQVTLTTRPLLDHRCRLLMLSRQRLQTGLQLA